jgi:hypothetical protein
MKNHNKTTKTESAKKQIVKTQVSNTELKNIPREIQELADRLSRLLRKRAGMSQATMAAVSEDGWFVGIDLGDRKSNHCFLDVRGEIVAEGTVATTQGELEALFSSIPKCRIAIEVGTHSPWVSAFLESHGHEVIVANPRKMESIRKNRRENDKVDARTLARLVRADPELLYPIRHRGVEVRYDLVLLRARDALVAVRTKLINCVRGQLNR